MWSSNGPAAAGLSPGPQGVDLILLNFSVCLVRLCSHLTPDQAFKDGEGIEVLGFFFGVVLQFYYFENRLDDSEQADEPDGADGAISCMIWVERAQSQIHNC